MLHSPLCLGLWFPFLLASLVTSAVVQVPSANGPSPGGLKVLRFPLQRQINRDLLFTSGDGFSVGDLRNVSAPEPAPVSSLKSDLQMFSTNKRSVVDVAVNRWTGLVWYTMNISIGSPPQSLAVYLDTGSSDLVVPSPASGICVVQGSTCSSNLGSYDPTSSKTYKTKWGGKSDIFAYGGTDMYSASPATDTLYMGTARIPNATFFVATKLTLQAQGVPLGLAFRGAQQQSSQYGTYPTVLEGLVSNGVITSRTFSIYLGDSFVPGSVVFGGVDTAKYVSPLKVLPVRIAPPATNHTLFYVDLTSVSVDRPGSKSRSAFSSNTTVIIDSGQPFASFPSAIYQQLKTSLNITTTLNDNGTSIPTVPCDLYKSGLNITFGLGGPQGAVISIPVTAFDATKYVTGVSGVCYIGIQQSAVALLGDPFLQYAYTVFDMEHGQLGIAPSIQGTSASKIVQIDPDTDLTQWGT